MSKSHSHNLGLITTHLKLWGIEECWQDVKCYPDKGITEICDVYGVVSKPIQGLWNDSNGSPVYIPGGLSIVGEYKDTKADLHADEEKPCRRRGNRAMGDYRMIWIREDGKIHPHDIDEEGPHYGWGVVVFNQHRATIAREPVRMSNVAFWEGARVYGQKLREDHQVAMAATRANIKLNTPRPVVKTVSAPRSEIIREDNGTYTDKHAKAAEDYIEKLPDTTARLLGHLEEETGWIGSPDKLTKHLKKHSKKLKAPSAGGNWTIK